jgi:imidazole glycerol-phosphate synthase subunit HisH
MSTIAVIDYGMGNLHSIAKALQHVGAEFKIRVTEKPEAILSAERIVFPGVGAIRDCMQALRQTGLAEVIKEVANTKPFLGICLGMQALLTDNEENGGTETLNIIPGHVVRFPEPLHDKDGNTLKIPHMGWNQVRQKQHPLWDNIPQDSRFYFVHSYYAKPVDASVIAGTSDYPNAFACALAHQNLFAVQFHPEKSQAVGLQLLRNFLLWDGCL